MFQIEDERGAGQRRADVSATATYMRPRRHSRGNDRENLLSTEFETRGPVVNNTLKNSLTIFEWKTPTIKSRRLTAKQTLTRITFKYTGCLTSSRYTVAQRQRSQHCSHVHFLLGYLFSALQLVVPNCYFKIVGNLAYLNCRCSWLLYVGFYNVHKMSTTYLIIFMIQLDYTMNRLTLAIPVLLHLLLTILLLYYPI